MKYTGNTILRPQLASINADHPTLKVGLVGSGESVDCLLEIIADQNAWAPLSPIKVSVWVNPPQGIGSAMGDQWGQVKIYPTFIKMLKEHSDLDIVCHLDDNDANLHELRRLAPSTATVISAGTVRRFCEAFKSQLLPVNLLNKYHQKLKLLSTTIDQVDEEVLVIDDNGIIVDLNQKILETEGGDKDDFIGRNWSVLRKNLFGESARKFLAMLLEVGHPVSEQYTGPNENGQIQNYRISVLPLKDENSRVRHIIITRKNITKRLLLEEQLRQSQKLATIGELSAHIAHEIRNPLTSIGGFARRLMLSPTLTDSDQEKAVIIHEECRRLDTVLKTVLGLVGPNQKIAGDTDVNEVVSTTVDLMKGEKKVKFQLTLANDLPKTSGNSHIVKQGLINLIKNSLEAVGEKGLIQVRTRYADGSVYIDVEDNGPGIAPHIQNEIFKPFFSTKLEGTGLGLSITRKLMTEIGGHLYIISKPGMTLFSMVLKPLLVAEKAQPGYHC